MAKEKPSKKEKAVAAKPKVKKPEPAKKPKKPHKKKKPKFNVLNAWFMPSVKSRWRKPRGGANKKRKRFAWAGASPRVGYKNPVAIRGLHPQGIPELLVYTPSQLEGVKDTLIRIAGSTGRKKRELIQAKAKELGLQVLNLKVSKPKTKTQKEKTEEKPKALPKTEPAAKPSEKGEK